MKSLFVVLTLLSMSVYAENQAVSNSTASTKPEVKKEASKKSDEKKESNLRSLTVGVENGFTQIKSGTDVNKSGGSVTLSVSAIYKDNMTFDWRAMTSQRNSYANAYGSPTSYQEFGPGYRHKLGENLPTASIKVYLQQYEKPTKRYLGYAVDLGLGDRILDTNFSWNIGYKRFDAFENSALNTARHTQNRVQISYAIDKKHSVYVKKQDQRGTGQQYDGLYVGYRHTF